MSFPSSPINNQQATVNGIVYSYSTVTTAWSRLAASSQVSALTAGTYTFALSSTGTVTLNGSVFSSGGGTAASGTGTTTTFVISNITQSTGTNSGALQVFGGAGIAGNLNVGGTVTGGGVRTTTTSTNPTNPTAGDFWYNTTNDVTYRYTYDGTNYYWVDTNGPNAGFFGIIAGTDIAVDVVTISNTSTLQSITGRGANTSNAISITNTTSSTSTTTGALVVKGGVGISGNIYVGGTTSSFIGNVGIGTVSPTWRVDLNLGTIDGTSTSTGGYNVFGDAGTAAGYTTYNMQLNNSRANASGYMRLARTTGTAYLGMQIASQSRDGIAFLTGATTATDQVRISASGTVTISATTDATSTNSGALQVAGGVGIGGNVIVGGVVTATNMYVNGYAVSTSSVGSINALNAGAYSVTLSTTGTLTVPNTIISSANTGSVQIQSIVSGTISNWVFGYNGSTGTITFPDGTVQTGAAGSFLGGTLTNVVNITNVTSSTSTNSGALTVVGGVGIGGNLAIGGTTILKQAQEVMVPVTSPGASAALNFNNGAIFYITGMSSNFTAAFSNVPTSANYVYATSLILAQGGTAYVVNAVTVNGVSQTIRWLGGSTATVTANRTDVISVTLAATGTNAYTVLASGGEYY
jgi:hypothetical protein